MRSAVLSTRQRAALVTVLDLVCLAAIAIAALSLFADVARFRVFGVRVSLRSPERALAWPVAIAALRWSLWWRTPLFPALRQPATALRRALLRTLVHGGRAAQRRFWL